MHLGSVHYIFYVLIQLVRYIVLALIHVHVLLLQCIMFNARVSQVSYCAYDTQTFITEVLRLVSNVQLLKNVLLIHCYRLLWLKSTCFVTKVTPIKNINSKCHNKETGEKYNLFYQLFSGFISCVVFLIAWGTDRHTQTNICTKVISRNHVCG